jgi:hypothetical protein
MPHEYARPPSFLFDCVVFLKVRFEERSVDAPRALLAFMNTLATDNSQALAGSKWCASRSALLLPPSLTF